MAATLSDIAAKTGLGVPTVSEILNDTPGRSYRPETRTRVIEAARALGYRANSSARAVRVGRFSAVAVVSSPHGGGRSWATHEMLSAIEFALRRHDLHMVLSSVDDASLTTEGSMPKVLRQLMVDGVLLNYTHLIPQRLIKLVESHRLPIIWLNAVRDHDCVYVDNQAGVENATKHLIKRGHRRIVYLSNQVAGEDPGNLHYTARDRLDGYVDAMQEAGLAPRVICQQSGTGKNHPFYQAMVGADRPTAAVCHQVELAHQALCLVARAGLSVPEDLSLITLTPEREVGLPQPLTRLVVHETDRADAAVEAMHLKLKKPSERLAPCVVELDLVDEEASVLSLK